MFFEKQRLKTPTIAQFNQGAWVVTICRLNIKVEYNKYDTWDGVGDMPDWLKGLLHIPMQIRKFCRGKPVYDAVSDNDLKQLSPPYAKPNHA